MAVAVVAVPEAEGRKGETANEELHPEKLVSGKWGKKICAQSESQKPIDIEKRRRLAAQRPRTETQAQSLPETPRVME